MVFLKDFYSEKLDFAVEKLHTTKKHAKLPSRQRIFFFKGVGAQWHLFLKQDFTGFLVFQMKGHRINFRECQTSAFGGGK